MRQDELTQRNSNRQEIMMQRMALYTAALQAPALASAAAAGLAGKNNVLFHYLLFFKQVIKPRKI